MNFCKKIIITLLICSCFVSAAKALQSPKYLFQIPVYPGTQLFKEGPDTKLLQLPFATILKVYRTADGSPLDKEKVIAFYKNHLESKGWKNAIFSRSGDEGYLGLTTHLFENLDDGTRIQLAGDFYLWVAPDDGMFTIFLKQWRISHVDQSTINRISSLLKSLDSIGARINYKVQKGYQDSEWEKDYENEYLIDRLKFMFIANDKQTSSSPSTGSIELSVLTYRDAKIAEEQGRQCRARLSDKIIGLGDNRFLINLNPGFNAVLIKDKNILLIQDPSGKQKKVVETVVGEIEKLW